MRRILLIATACLLIAPPTFAQLVVIDPANLYQAILIAERTLSQYNTLVQQYETIVRMGRSLAAHPGSARVQGRMAYLPDAASGMHGRNSRHRGLAASRSDAIVGCCNLARRKGPPCPA